MRPDGATTAVTKAVMLLKTAELWRSGARLPPDSPPVRKVKKAYRKGWLILSRAARMVATDTDSLAAGVKGCPTLELGMAEPPRLFGLFRRKPEAAMRWADRESMAGRFADDPVPMAKASRGHPVLSTRLLPTAALARGKRVPGKIRRPQKPHRIVSPVRSREELLSMVDPVLIDRYAKEAAGQERKRRVPKSPLRFSEGYPAKDLTSAIRLLVTAPGAEVAERLRSGTLSEWFREEAGETELAAVIDAAAHVAQERGVRAEEARVLLLKYLRRTPVGANLERKLVAPMAEALRSRDGALVAATAEALLLLDADLAAAELSSALFETEVAGRAAVINALGETGSPRAVSALERLAEAATRREDREGALAAIRMLEREGSAMDVASAALERLGHPAGQEKG
jgi:hypothetical protein